MVSFLLKSPLLVHPQNGGRLFSNHLICQNSWIFAKQLPGSKKRCPIDIGNQNIQININGFVPIKLGVLGV
jgi:hypothetical protein